MHKNVKKSRYSIYKKILHKSLCDLQMFYRFNNNNNNSNAHHQLR